MNVKTTSVRRICKTYPFTLRKTVFCSIIHGLPVCKRIAFKRLWNSIWTIYKYTDWLRKEEYGCFRTNLGLLWYRAQPIPTISMIFLERQKFACQLGKWKRLTRNMRRLTLRDAVPTRSRKVRGLRLSHRRKRDSSDWCISADDGMQCGGRVWLWRLRQFYLFRGEYIRRTRHSWQQRQIGLYTPETRLVRVSDLFLLWAHFQKNKQGTPHTVKSFVLSDQTSHDKANKINNFIQ